MTATREVPSAVVRKPAAARPESSSPKPEAQILFQRYFKSVGPRTYAAQLKRAGNGNHFLVLTEGKRDDKTGDVRKTRLFVFSEDFEAFFNLLGEVSQFIKSHPVPDQVRQKRARFWAKAGGSGGAQHAPPRSVQQTRAASAR